MSRDVPQAGRSLLRKPEACDPKRRYPCPSCPKAFAKPSQLDRHSRTHTGSKPFSCEVCSAAFTQKNSLQAHMKRHTGERPFVCPFCAFAFTQKCNLKTHIQRAHAEQAQILVERTKTTYVSQA